MTTTQEHFTEAAQAGRKAMTAAVRSWGETVTAVTGMPTGRAAAGPQPQRVLDAWFDVAGEALAAQRELAKALLCIGNPAVDVMTRAAQRTMEATQQYADAATEETGRAPERSDQTERRRTAEGVR